MSDAGIAGEIVKWGRSLFERGLSPGGSGNISARTSSGFIATPTNVCLGFLNVDALSRLDAAGGHVAGDRPTKEWPLHAAFFKSEGDIGAVVHLHSTYATLVSCLADIDPSDPLPPMTPYVTMRVGRSPVIPYVRPGSNEVGPLVDALTGGCRAVLLANHGPIVGGPTVEAAVFAAEELEEAAKLMILAQGRMVRRLTRADIAELTTVFGSPGATTPLGRG